MHAATIMAAEGHLSEAHLHKHFADWKNEVDTMFASRFVDFELRVEELFKRYVRHMEAQARSVHTKKSEESYHASREDPTPQVRSVDVHGQWSLAEEGLPALAPHTALWTAHHTPAGAVAAEGLHHTPHYGPGGFRVDDHRMTLTHRMARRPAPHTASDGASYRVVREDIVYFDALESAARQGDDGDAPASVVQEQHGQNTQCDLDTDCPVNILLGAGGGKDSDPQPPGKPQLVAEVRFDQEYGDEEDDEDMGFKASRSTHAKKNIRQTGLARRSVTQKVGAAVQLNRKIFHERLDAELFMAWTFSKAVTFVLVLVSYFVCLSLYQPTGGIAELHRYYRDRFKFQDLDTLLTHDDIMNYLQEFAQLTYDMAPALVDANTMDAIDPAKCFLATDRDICKMRYWSAPFDRKGSANHADWGAILKDKVGAADAGSSIFCDVEEPPDPDDVECINRSKQLNKQMKGRAYGQTPESPLLFSQRIPFPAIQIAILTPVVWQKRSPMGKCGRFGATYNNKFLGAGLCKAEEDCTAETLTSFYTPYMNPHSGRTQNIYLTYEDDVVRCVDRSKLVSEFRDLSWDPWASYNDMKHGREKEPEMLNGEPIFYKFYSDVAYLQAPIEGSSKLKDPAGCPSPPDVTDPLFQAHHPMWAHASNDSRCSQRRIWAREYKSRPITERRNTFLDLETTELTVANLVTSPQVEGLGDVTSVIKVTWTFTQGGSVHVNGEILSTSETTSTWYASILVLGFMTLMYIVFLVIHHLRAPFYTSRLGLTVDTLLGLAPVTMAVGLLHIDTSEPWAQMTKELLKTFEFDDQPEYFKAILGVTHFGTTVHNAAKYAVFIGLALFLRLIVYFSVHPRMGILVETFKYCAFDMMHFVVVFLSVYLVTGFLAYWMFSGKRSDYGTFAQTLYTQFAMFVGELERPMPELANDPVYTAYLLFYIMLQTMVMLNFLMAIIIKAYSFVVSRVDAEGVPVHDIVTDLYDCGIGLLRRRWYKWPTLEVLLKSLEKNTYAGSTDDFDELPGVTAVELYSHCKVDGAACFQDIGDAQYFINIYATKVVREGTSLLIERREDRLLPAGSMYSAGIQDEEEREGDVPEERE